MRLTWINIHHIYSGLSRFRDIKKKHIQPFYDIGFRTAGLMCDTEATDDDIRYVTDLWGETGLEFGPIGAGGNAVFFHPDNRVTEKGKPLFRKTLEIGGKLGCPNVRFAAGTFDPTNVWAAHRENHTQKAMDMFVAATKEFIPAAEDNAIMLCPETTQGTIVGSISRMKEYVDRLESRYAGVDFDPVNHMTHERIFESGRFISCAIATLGDRIGEIHCKDVKLTEGAILVSHIDEAPMGAGELDHAALIKASTQLEPWKPFSLEHITTIEGIRAAYDHIMTDTASIGHEWTPAGCTRSKWEKSR